MQRLLKLPKPPDAVFAASDPIAIGALQAALEANLNLPGDFGLIGVGNHRYGRFLRVPLSTMDQQRSQIGHLAANLLFESMVKKRPRSKSILTEPKLVVRDSSNRGGLSERPTAVGDNKRSVKHAARR
jgi:LacI family transcriptional regulator